MNKRKGFTLIELIIATLIAAIVLAVGINIIGGSFSGLKENNKDVDLQTDVRNSLKNIVSVVKSSRQIFFVGKDVIDPDQLSDSSYIDKIDTKYNYIVMKKDPDKGDQLVNMVYDSKNKDWIMIPLTSTSKVVDSKVNDLYDAKKSFKIKFYDGTDYLKDIDNHIVNVTVYGNIKEGNKDKNYKLSQNIEAQNVNQIMISKYLEGGIGDITAMAYAKNEIKATTGESEDNFTYAIAFIIDNSSSLKDKIEGGAAANFDESRYGILYKALATNQNSFIKELNKIKVSKADQEADPKNAKIKTYFIPFNGRVVYNEVNYTSDSSMSYLAQNGVGPYNLSKKSELKRAEEFLANMKPYGSTNSGEGILQGLYVLKNTDADRKYIIFLSDGNPTDLLVNSKKEHTVRIKTRKLDCQNPSFNTRQTQNVKYYDVGSKDYTDMFFLGTNGATSDAKDFDTTGSNVITCISSSNRTRDIKQTLVGSLTMRDHYVFGLQNYAGRIFNLRMGMPVNEFVDFFDLSQLSSAASSNVKVLYDFPLEYCKAVTDPKNGWMDGINKAFLIGYTGLRSEKSKIGFDKHPDSLYSYFKRSPDLQGNDDKGKDKVKTFDAYSEEALIDALTQISKIIEYDMNVFEGPKTTD